MNVDIEMKSGFCFGVVRAIRRAEEILEKEGQLYALGEIVHNGEEMERLSKKGLQTLSKDDYKHLTKAKVLIRAHGEPPETYHTAVQNKITLADATCPVVLNLQIKIKEGYEKYKEQGGQVVIFGRKGHPEVIGLIGQVEGDALLVENVNDVSEIDFKKPVLLYSQTTRDPCEFDKIAGTIREQMDKEKGNTVFEVHDTICERVRSRRSELEKFSHEHDMIIFVSGKNSSNGKMLYSICKNINDHTYFISNEDEINVDWFKGVNNVGICGATSTPQWLMERIKKAIDRI